MDFRVSKTCDEIVQQRMHKWSKPTDSQCLDLPSCNTFNVEWSLDDICEMFVARCGYHQDTTIAYACSILNAACALDPETDSECGRNKRKCVATRSPHTHARISSVSWACDLLPHVMIVHMRTRTIDLLTIIKRMRINYTRTTRAQMESVWYFETRRTNERSIRLRNFGFSDSTCVSRDAPRIPN